MYMHLSSKNLHPHPISWLFCLLTANLRSLSITKGISISVRGFRELFTVGMIHCEYKQNKLLAQPQTSIKPIQKHLISCKILRFFCWPEGRKYFVFKEKDHKQCISVRHRTWTSLKICLPVALSLSLAEPKTSEIQETKLNTNCNSPHF